MRVLSVGYDVPAPDRDAGGRRTVDILRWCVGRGDDVTHVAVNGFGDPTLTEALTRIGVAVVDGSTASFADVVTTQRPDLVLVAFWQVAEQVLPVVRRLRADARVVVDSVDLQFVRDARRRFLLGRDHPAVGGLDADYADELIGELNVYAASDLVLTVSSKEASLVDDLVGEPRTAVIPLLEDIDVSAVPAGERRGILFVGSFRHPPNLDAVGWLCDDVLDRIDGDLTRVHPLSIVGDGLDDTVAALAQGRADVELVGWVPSLVPYLHRARVVVAPLRYGAGTKHKMVQALMAGTPAVSTSIGTEGLHLTDGFDVLVADDAASFAAAIERLLTDDDLWHGIAERARAGAEDLHGRHGVHGRLEAAWSTVAGRPPRPHPGWGTDRDTYDRRVRNQVRQKVLGPLQRLVRDTVPGQASVAVIADGAADLLALDCRHVEAFPSSGRDDELAVIAELDAARERGVTHLVVPSGNWRWIRDRPEVRRHLDTTATLATHRSDIGVIWALEPPRRPVITPLPVDRWLGHVPPDQAAAVAVPVDIPAAAIEHARPDVAAAVHALRRPPASSRVLVLGVYLASRATLVSDIVDRLAEADLDVDQRWLALGGSPAPGAVGDVTVRSVLEPTPKFELLNELLAAIDLDDYDHVVVTDDDVVVPHGFLDHLLAAQLHLDLALAQPSRTTTSFTDLPIVTQQRGVLARRTRFVEIGPVFSVARVAFDLVLPFDTVSSMGWGYENVWARRLVDHDLGMGIIDAVPVDHSLRPSATLYDHAAAERERDALWAANAHLPSDECFTVVDVAPLPVGARS